MMKGWWWWIELKGIGKAGGGAQECLCRRKVACVSVLSFYAHPQMFVHVMCVFVSVWRCVWRCGHPVQRRCVSPVYGGLQTSDSSLESDVCQYRQHGEAALALGQHQSQYLKTGNTHMCIHEHQNHTHTHSRQANNCSRLLSWPGPSSDTSHN